MKLTKKAARMVTSAYSTIVDDTICLSIQKMFRVHRTLTLKFELDEKFQPMVTYYVNVRRWSPKIVEQVCYHYQKYGTLQEALNAVYFPWWEVKRKRK